MIGLVEDFHFDSLRNTIGPLLIFAAAGMAALVFALLTVGYQSIKAAMANPVKSINYE